MELEIQKGLDYLKNKELESSSREGGCRLCVLVERQINNLKGEIDTYNKAIEAIKEGDDKLYSLLEK